MATPTVERYAVSGQMVLEDDAPDRADALAARFRDGDPRALEEVYREHGTLVHSFCRRSLGDTRAADATQEVFLAAWRSRERYRPDAGTLAGWLMGIARFKVIDAHRAEQRQPLTVDLTGPVEPVAGSGDLDQIAQRLAFGLHRCAMFAAIPRQHRAVALAGEQERHFFARFDRRIAHQIDSLRVGTATPVHAARIDQRHEYQPDRLQLVLQYAIPLQPADQAAQIHQQDMRTDTFQPVHAAKETDRRHFRAGVAERQRIHGKGRAIDGNAATLAHFQPVAAFFDDAFQFCQFRQHRLIH